MVQTLGDWKPDGAGRANFPEPSGCSAGLRFCATRG